MARPVWRRSPEATASSKVCPAGASTGRHTAKPPTAAAVAAVALPPVTECYRWTGPGHQPVTGSCRAIELQPMAALRHQTGRLIEPTAVAATQPMVRIRHAPDPTHRAATTTNPMTPSGSTTTATATNFRSNPLFEDPGGEAPGGSQKSDQPLGAPPSTHQSINLLSPRVCGVVPPDRSLTRPNSPT